MHLINNGEKQPDPNALEFIRYRVIGKPYSKWRAIITEATGESDTLFLAGLYHGHNIRIENKDADPMLYLIQDTGQMRELREQGVENPTTLQIALSTKIWSLSEQDAIDRMAAWCEAHKASATDPDAICEQCGCKDYAVDLACCPECGGKRQ